MSARPVVRLWHWVTVASRFLSMAATGLPTISLRPRTTTRFPAIETPVLSMSVITPEGVQGENKGLEALDERCPMLYAWKLMPRTINIDRHGNQDVLTTHPSTSLSGLMASVTCLSPSEST